MSAFLPATLPCFRNIVSFLEGNEISSLLSVSKSLKHAVDDLPDSVWREVVLNSFRNILPSVIDRIPLKENVTWRVFLQAFWKDLSLDMANVITDPHFLTRASYLHLGRRQEEEEEEEPSPFNLSIRPKRDTIRILTFDSLLNSFGDHEVCEEYLLDNEDVPAGQVTKEAFLFECSAIYLPLPQDHYLKILIGAEGVYFNLDSLDIGRIDGHQSMPALRWPEVKDIFHHVCQRRLALRGARRDSLSASEQREYDYLRAIAAVSNDALLAFLALLSYPTTTEEYEEYKQIVGDAHHRSGAISTEEGLHAWRRLLIQPSDVPAWQQADFEGKQVWTHPWSSRSVRKLQFCRQVDEILGAIVVSV
eukprot:gene41176-50243_t